jgi:two-component system response regulator AtoC
MLSSTANSFLINSEDLPPDAILFGSTAAMREVQSRIHCVLDNDLPVLIQGESGAGKELIARFLHSHSSRRSAPFVKFNCAALPASLLESELMGYEKGAFTGAYEMKPGLFELAESGTLFLDGISDMESGVQRKLLQVLQDGRYYRIGGFEELQSHARVISATNVNMEAAVGAGTFRKDLFYRIDVISLYLLPLRERKEDIPQISEYLLQKVAAKFGKSAPRLTPAALDLLTQWAWPGNMRELENWLARVVILGSEEVPSQELVFQMALVSKVPCARPRTGSLKEVSREAASAEARIMIRRALQANNGNIRKAAEELNMSYRWLLYKLREADGRPRRRNHKGSPHGQTPN